MANEGKLNDLDYCYASFEMLKDLEKVSFSRNERIRLFQEKANSRESIVIGGLSLILPLFLCGFVLLSSGGVKAMLSGGDNAANVGTRMFGLLMLSAFLFLFTFILLKKIWNSKPLRPLKKMTEKDLRTTLKADVAEIDQKSIEIVESELFLENRVPENFLSAEMLVMLIRYFEGGQAGFMKEAVYALKLELKNTGYYANVVPKQTLLQKEKEYLSDEKNNLEKKIEEGEKL